MKLPMPAPEVETILMEILERDQREYLKIFTTNVEDDRYLHWDQLRYRTPPNDWGHREWWAALKLARGRQQRFLKLTDKEKSPFWFNMTDRILRTSEEIARRASGHIGSAEEVIGAQGRDQYIVKSLIEEAITSSQLEGAVTSRRVATEMLESGRPPTDKSEVMILNNYLAMRRIREAATEPLTPDFVLELHRILTEDTLEDPADAGRLETADQIRVAVWDGEIAIHQPPSADELPSRLRSLCDFANDLLEHSPYMPPVVRAIIVHFMVGYDHYFADGNGRTARALFYWSMLHQGYWLSEYVSISKILKKAPSQYSLAYLYTEDDGGDLTYFIHYQLEIFIRALDELDEYLAAKSRELAQVRGALQGTRELNQRQASFLERASREGDLVIDAAGYARYYRVTGQTARNDLRSMESSGYLLRSKNGNAFVWRAAPKLLSKLAAK
ncbi:Fic family protein [Psychromicrobium sp. YIM B11713]|uniref:Fic family protein n=1 Tax=Psychromicrobium sp. YIM B11713 TaxID=3145233 RepID=UPI00374FD3C8